MPPGEKEIREVEKALEELTRCGDHANIRKLNRALLDVGLQADFDVSSMKWRVRQQKGYDELRDGILKEQENERSAREVQEELHEREVKIHDAFQKKLRELSPDQHEEMAFYTQQAMAEVDQLRREAQRSEVRWNKPTPEMQKEARSWLEGFGGKHSPKNPFMQGDDAWTDQKAWGKQNEKQREEERRKKEEEDRLSAPDIDRSLAALLDGIDIDMKGEPSGQEETSDGASAQGDAGSGGDSDGEEAGDFSREDDEDDERGERGPFKFRRFRTPWNTRPRGGDFED